MKSFTTLLVFLVISHCTYAQWKLIHSDSLYFEVMDLHFINKDTGFVCGQIHHAHGYVLRTTDGGKTWTPNHTGLFLEAIHFINDSTGYTGGQDGAILRTVNMGESWENDHGLPYNDDFVNWHFQNDSSWIIKSHSGGIYFTRDYGITWERCDKYIGGEFYERHTNPFYFFNIKVGFVAGYGVFKTIDYGRSWVIQNADKQKHYKSVYMLNEQRGFLVGNNGIFLESTSGGKNWFVNNTLTDQDLRDIKFVNDSVGYCVGGGFNYDNDTTGILLYTTDSGDTWDLLKLSDSRLNSIQFVNESLGFITGNYGQIFRITNADSVFNIVEENIMEKLDQKELIFPNPSQNECQIIIPTDPHNIYHFTLLDLHGKILREFSFRKENKFQLNDLNAGTYIYTLSNDAGYYNSGKIIRK